MHIALILDNERLLHESVMLSRLSVGLIDEGCTLTRIIPTGHRAVPGERSDGVAGIATNISVPLRVLPWLRRSRAEQVADALPRTVPDVVYAWGKDTWTLARDLGRRFECPVAINIWCADLLRSLPRGRHARAFSAFITPTRPLADALREVVDPSLVSRVPQGVVIPKSPWPVFGDPQRPAAAAIIGSGRDVVSYRALLSGLSRVLKQNGSLHAFIELRGPQQHEIWRHARRLELLESISAITDAARFRSLLTQCDTLILPERYGEVRSLTLDAMAMGVPVVAAEDHFLDYLIAEETALLVTEAEPEQWTTQLLKLLSSPEFPRQLGLSARKYVQQHHSSTSQVSKLLETLKRAVHGDTIGFAATSQ